MVPDGVNPVANSTPPTLFVAEKYEEARSLVSALSILGFFATDNGEFEMCLAMGALEDETTGLAYPGDVPRYTVVVSLFVFFQFEVGFASPTGLQPCALYFDISINTIGIIMFYDYG